MFEIVAVGETDAVYEGAPDIDGVTVAVLVVVGVVEGDIIDGVVEGDMVGVHEGEKLGVTEGSSDAVFDTLAAGV